MNREAVVTGLTGQTGAGKTTVCNSFEKKGFAVINADIIARKAVRKGEPCLDEIVKHFGREILLENGELDRKKLGGIVFSDKDKLELLDSIVYPFIMDYISEEITEAIESGRRFILLDAPTLFESGADSLCDVIVSVTADSKLRLMRIIERDGMTREQALDRMASQHDEAFFRKNSEYIIENNGSIQELSEAAEKTADTIINLFKNK